MFVSAVFPAVTPPTTMYVRTSRTDIPMNMIVPWKASVYMTAMSPPKIT